MAEDFLDWLGFKLVCNSPAWIQWRAIDADHWLGKWALPHAGGWAYREHQ